MTNYFEIVAENLVKLGIHQYLLPFILLTALVFALLRKSKLLGESSVVNGAVALVVSFMVIFGMPVAIGLRFATSLSVFLMQVSVFIIIFFIGFLIASLFYPNMMDWLPKVFVSRSMFMVAITLAIVFFITSGMIGIVFTPSPMPGEPTIPTDLTVLIVGIFLFITFVLIATVAVREVKK